MPGFTDAFQKKILDNIFKGTAYSPALPTTWYVGLFTTNPGGAGTGGVEATGGSYARQGITQANFNAATAASPSVLDNTNVVTFPTASADWGTITGWGLFDAASAGNLVAWGVISPSKAILNGDTASFAAGSLDVILGEGTPT